MKTEKNVLGLKVVSVLAIAVALLLNSCTKSSDAPALSASDTQNVNSESAADSYSSDATDMANVSIGSISASTYSGRMDGSVDTLKTIDDRFKCATFTLNRTGTKDHPAGVLTIDFGTGCNDARGVTRKGQIIVTYNGRRFIPKSTIITTFNGYSRNDVKVEGTYSLTNIEATTADFPLFSVDIVGGKITFTDGKVITRVQHFTREWQRSPNPTQDKWVILKGGTASGVSKTGNNYTMTIATDLVYSRPCEISDKVFIPVSGVKVFIDDGKQYTVDYGSGSCDNDITVTVGTVSKTITVSADGN